MRQYVTFNTVTTVVVGDKHMKAPMPSASCGVSTKN